MSSLELEVDVDYSWKKKEGVEKCLLLLSLEFDLLSSSYWGVGR